MKLFLSLAALTVLCGITAPAHAQPRPRDEMADVKKIEAELDKVRALAKDLEAKLKAVESQRNRPDNGPGDRRPEPRGERPGAERGGRPGGERGERPNAERGGRPDGERGPGANRGPGPNFGGGLGASRGFGSDGMRGRGPSAGGGFRAEGGPRPGAERGSRSTGGDFERRLNRIIGELEALRAEFRRSRD